MATRAIVATLLLSAALLVVSLWAHRRLAGGLFLTLLAFDR